MLRKNIGLKLASILVALLLFLYVESQVLNTNKSSVPFQVVPEGLPEEFTYTVVKQPIVDVWGTPDDIQQINARMKNPDPNDIGKLYVDLSGAAVGKGSYRAYLRNPPYRDLHSLDWGHPDPVAIIVEPKVQRTFPVSVVPYNLPSGLRFKATTVPDTVTVFGSSADLKKVAQITTSLDLKGFQNGTVLRNRRVSAVDASNTAIPGATVQPSFVDVYPSLYESEPEKLVFVSPVIAGQPAFGYQVENISVSPDQVTVSGDPDEVRATQILQTEPLNITDVTQNVQRRVKIVIKRNGIDVNKHVVTVTVRLRKLPVPPEPKPKPTLTPTVPAPLIHTP